MPITSDQVSSLISSNNQQMLQSMQQASFITQQSGGRSQGEGLMAHATNVGASIGGPIAMGAMAVAGLDPMSAGIRGGMAGFGAAGIAGGALGAVGGAAAVGVPLMALQYGGQQMLQGMQQQQQLNSTLRQNYGFMGQTGRGFSQGEMGSIGQMMRTQSGQIGAGGEITGFSELAQLAANMSRLGGAQNIRTAKDFTDKFQQMLKTIKEVATSMSTSLEQAQEVMGAMRNSGIFRGQGAVAGQIKNVALAGGMATSEVTSMMGIGSQISRMVGGLGGAGAMGGMRAIAQVGQAQQAGLISEEDIYNATGQTGAEGRQAMAMQGMQRSASFLKGGLGRRMLASMAGRDGTLGAGTAEEIMGGGVGTGRTRQMWGQQLGKTGRANFILNEGRMRGAALEKFGGLADVAVMKGWLDDRGMDDERQNIFMMRRLGVGRDELDTSLKMLQNLPLMEQQKNLAADNAGWSQKLEQQRSRMGVSGIKRKLEEARHEVQNVLQQKGAEFYQEGANVLDRWVKTLTGDYVRTVDRDVGMAIKDVMRGTGAISTAVAKSRFGLGGTLRGAAYGAQGVFGGSSQSNIDAMRVSGDIGRIQEAGFGGVLGTDRMMQNPAKLREGLATIQKITGAYTEGSSDWRYGALGEGAREELRLSMAQGKFTGRGMGALSEFSTFLEKAQDPRLRSLANKYGNASDEERARIRGDLMRGAGLGAQDAVAMASPEMKAVLGQGGFRTETDQARAMGDYMLSRSSAKDGALNQFAEKRGSQVGGAVKWGVRAAALLTPIGGMFTAADLISGGKISGWLGDVAGGITRRGYEGPQGTISQGARDAAGRQLTTESGRNFALGALSRDEDVRKRTMDQLAMRNASLLADVNHDPNAMADAVRGEFETNRSTLMASDYAKLMESSGGKPSKDQMASLVQKHNASGWKDVEARSQMVIGSATEGQRRAQTEMFQRAGVSGRKELAGFQESKLTMGGVLSGKGIGLGAVGKLEAVSDARMQKAVGWDSSLGAANLTTGQQFLASMQAAAAQQSKITGLQGAEQTDAAALGEARQLRQGGFDALGRMSVSEKLDLSRNLRTGGGAAGQALAGEVSAQAGMHQQLQRAGSGERGDFMVGKLLNVKLSKDEIGKLGADDLAGLIAGRKGIDLGTEEGKGFQEQVRQAISLQRQGKGGEAAGLLKGASESGAVQAAQKEKQEGSAREADPNFRKLESIDRNIGRLADVLTGEKGKKMQVEVTNIDQLKDPKPGEDKH